MSTGCSSTEANLAYYEEILPVLSHKKESLVYKVCYVPWDSFTCRGFCTFEWLLCLGDLFYCMFDITQRKNVTSPQKHAGINLYIQIYIHKRIYRFVIFTLNSFMSLNCLSGDWLQIGVSLLPSSRAAMSPGLLRVLDHSYCLSIFTHRAASHSQKNSSLHGQLYIDVSWWKFS